MLIWRDFVSVAIAALFCCTHTAGAYRIEESKYERRDDSNTPITSLEPVIPPNVNEDALATLALKTDITLAWAGSSTGSGARRMLKRDGGVFTQASFAFRYPTVPLDYSNFVSGVSCSGGVLTAVLTDVAYTYAKKQWTGAKDIVFVTSVDGCGAVNANDMFHTSSITFSDSGKSFSAKGASADYKEVARHMSLKWGDVGALKLKRAIDKREVCYHPSQTTFCDTCVILTSPRLLSHTLFIAVLDSTSPLDGALTCRISWAPQTMLHGITPRCSSSGAKRTEKKMTLTKKVKSPMQADTTSARTQITPTTHFWNESLTTVLPCTASNVDLEAKQLSGVRWRSI
jgi:hypothetical protein